MKGITINQPPSFKYPCCRCGLCCHSLPCKVAIIVLSADPKQPCPAIRFLGHGRTECAIVDAAPVPAKDRLEQLIKEANIMGWGLGCCMVGYAANEETGVTVEFAALSPETKFVLAKRIREKKVEIKLNGNAFTGRF